jgi:hypothetical protein
MRVSGNSRRNWQPARACCQGPNHYAPNRGETGWTTARSPGEVGATSVHSKPVFVCSVALSSMKSIAPPSTKKESSALDGRQHAKPLGIIIDVTWAGGAVEPRTITGRTRSSSGQHTTTIRLSRLHFLPIGASRQRLEFFVRGKAGAQRSIPAQAGEPTDPHFRSLTAMVHPRAGGGALVGRGY